MKGIILTTKGKEDRLKLAKEEVRKIGIEPDVFYAIDAITPKVSFNRSMKHLMMKNDGVVGIFEDDVHFKVNNHFNMAISQLPTDWELCYLGANITGVVERYSPNLFLMNGGWTTHAVIYNNPKLLCENYDDYYTMFDDWLSKEIHPRGKTFIVSPMIAWQRVHYSELWDHEADYTYLFDASANKLI